MTCAWDVVNQSGWATFELRGPRLAFTTTHLPNQAILKLSLHRSPLQPVPQIILVQLLATNPHRTSPKIHFYSHEQPQSLNCERLKSCVKQKDNLGPTVAVAQNWQSDDWDRASTSDDLSLLKNKSGNLKMALKQLTGSKTSISHMLHPNFSTRPQTSKTNHSMMCADRFYWA